MDKLPDEILKQIAATSEVVTIKLRCVSAQLRSLIWNDKKQCFLKLSFFLSNYKQRRHIFFGSLEGRPERGVLCERSTVFENGTCSIPLALLKKGSSGVLYHVKGRALTMLIRAIFDEQLIDSNARLPYICCRNSAGNHLKSLLPQTTDVKLHVESPSASTGSIEMEFNIPGIDENILPIQNLHTSLCFTVDLQFSRDELLVSRPILEKFLILGT